MILPIRKDIAAKIREMLGWKPRHEELEVICSTADRWEAKRAGTPPHQRSYVSGQSA